MPPATVVCDINSAHTFMRIIGHGILFVAHPYDFLLSIPLE